jgi:hypothetical protein
LRSNYAAWKAKPPDTFRVTAVTRHEPGYTTRPIATLLNFAAIGIEDAIKNVGIGCLRLVQPQQLVETDARMPVSQLHNLLGGRHRGATNNEKVVTQTVHLGEM